MAVCLKSVELANLVVPESFPECVFVCVCVCVRERERERTRERENERERERAHAAMRAEICGGHRAGPLPLPPNSISTEHP